MGVPTIAGQLGKLICEELGSLSIRAILLCVGWVIGTDNPGPGMPTVCNVCNNVTNKAEKANGGIIRPFLFIFNYFPEFRRMNIVQNSQTT